MPKNNETTTKFKVDISELVKGMQSAKRQIALANAEFKSATAGMDNWSKSADGVSAKLTQLDKTLHSQKSILATLEKQYELTAKEMGADSKEAENLKIKIENQKASIGKTEKEMRQYNSKLDELGKESQDGVKESDKLGKSLDKVGKEANESSKGFTVLKGALSNLVADGIRASINGLKSLGQSMLDTATKADDLNTEAKVTGVDTKTLQEWQYASQFIDTSVDTMTGSMKKLTKNMTSESKSVVGAFKQLGVKTKDATGGMRDNTDVFFDIIDALGKVKNETERDAIAMTLFGKSATDLNPLIEAGADELSRLSKEANDVGAVLDQDTIDSFNGLNDAMDKLKSTGGAVFAELGKEVLDTGIVDEFITFVQEDALPSVKEFIEFIIKNKDTVVSSVTAIGAGLLAFNVSSMIMNTVNAIKAFQVANEGATVAQALFNTVLKANPIVLVVSIIASLVAMLVTFIATNEKARKKVAEIWGGIKDSVASAVTAIGGYFTSLWNGIVTGATNAWNKVKSIFSATGKVFKGVKEGVGNLFKAIVNSLIRGINTVIALPFKGVNKALSKIKNVSIAGAHPFKNLISTIDIPKIPELYRGGVLKKGQVGYLEGNGDEAVVPLEHNTGWLDEVASRIVAKGGTIGSNGGNVTNNYNYEYNQTNNSPKALSRLEIYRQTRNQLAFSKGV